MNNNLIALMTTALVADILLDNEYGHVDIEESSIILAERLVENGIDLDFVLVVAGGNKNNLREVGNLALVELMRIIPILPVEVYDVSNNNGNKR